MNVDTGQYINLWMPSISSWSFLQRHPFMVASCEAGEWTTLVLSVDPQKGLTSKLQRLTSTYDSKSPKFDQRRVYTPITGFSFLCKPEKASISGTADSAAVSITRCYGPGKKKLNEENRLMTAFESLISKQSTEKTAPGSKRMCK